MQKTAVKTIKLPLVSPPEEVREKLDRFFEDVRRIYNETGRRLPSLGKKRRIERKTDPVYYNWVQSFRRKVDLPAQVAQEAVQKARESYVSMLANRNFDGFPISHGEDVARFHNQSFRFQNFGGWFFLSIPIQGGRKDNRVILPIQKNSYSNGVLEEMIDGEDGWTTGQDMGCGASELKKYKKNYSFNLVTRESVNIHNPATPVGVDFGIRNIAAACAWSKKKAHINLWSGKRMWNKWNQYRKRLQEASSKGEPKKIKKNKFNYAKNENHRVSSEIVEFADQFFEPYIILEDLHKFRKQNDWRFAMLREYIEYKALDRGIPTVAVNPRNTSNECNKCGYTDPDNRDEIHFQCLECGYQVNADVNAAINLSKTTIKGKDKKKKLKE